MITIAPNTDSVDIDQKCIGLNASRTTFPPDVREHIHTNRGLHIQIRHNGDKQTFAQANDIARLIAVAPEILAALKVLRAKLIQYAGPENALYEIGDANQVIAKAEGNTT